MLVFFYLGFSFGWLFLFCLDFFLVDYFWELFLVFLPQFFPWLIFPRSFFWFCSIWVFSWSIFSESFHWFFPSWFFLRSIFPGSFLWFFYFISIFSLVDCTWGFFIIDFLMKISQEFFNRRFFFLGFFLGTFFLGSLFSGEIPGNFFPEFFCLKTFFREIFLVLFILRDVYRRIIRSFS